MSDLERDPFLSDPSIRWLPAAIGDELVAELPIRYQGRLLTVMIRPAMCLRALRVQGRPWADRRSWLEGAVVRVIDGGVTVDVAETGADGLAPWDTNEFGAAVGSGVVDWVVRWIHRNPTKCQQAAKRDRQRTQAQRRRPRR